MHQRRYYALAFLLVLLVASASAYLVYQAIEPIRLPRLDAVATLQQTLAELDLASLLPRRNPTQPQRPSPTAEPTVMAALPAPTAIVEQEAVSTATVPVTGTVAAAPAEPATPAPPAATPAAPAPPTAAERPTATPAPPTPTPTSAPASPPNAIYAFQPAGAVRHGSSDCPGPSIRGAVRDAAGNPLPGVRLWRYDQWGNQQTVETKSAQVDLGQYDFPLGDTPNVHYVQVVDAGGSPISPTLEVQHRQGDASDAACHWIDWVRR